MAFDMPSGGLFITLEGGEGAGKSTQAQRLAERLHDEGHEVCLTREPGGTPGAEALRQIILFGGESLCWRAEVLVHMAARCDHLDRRISPALAQGKIVICDRFHDSTWAYQGYGWEKGRLEALAFISSLRDNIGHEPELTLWLDVPLETGLKRVVQRGRKCDRYEQLDNAFHQRVRDGFEQLYRADQQKAKKRIERIDAMLSPDRVHEALYMAVKKRIEARE